MSSICAGGGQLLHAGGHAQRPAGRWAGSAHPLLEILDLLVAIGHRLVALALQRLALGLCGGQLVLQHGGRLDGWHECSFSVDALCSAFT